MNINWGLIIGILCCLMIAVGFAMFAFELKERTEICENASGEWSHTSSICVIDNFGYEIIQVKNKWVLLNGEQE